MSWRSGSGKRGGVIDAREKINAKLRQKDARSLIQANRKKKNFDARGLIVASRKNTIRDARSIINNRQIPVLPLKDRTMVMPQRTVKNDLYAGSQKGSANSQMRNASSRIPSGKFQFGESQQLTRPARSQRLTDNKKYSTNMPLNLRITRDVSPEPKTPTTFPKSALSGSGSAQFSPLQGFKLQVRNLHPSVTNDDLYELFSSIGRLRQCRLLRPGVGEVIYHEREDAVNAISQYNTRELDGQPMAVQLITSTSALTAAVQRRNSKQFPKEFNPQDMEVEYETVTKALFNVSHQPSVRRPVNFVVNM